MPDSYGDPQAEQSSLVVVRRKLEWKLDFRAFARSSAEGPPIVVAFSTSRCGDPWSKRDKSQMKSACDYPLSESLQNQRGNQRVLRSLFPRPDVSTFLLFAIFLHVAVQQHVGQDADPG